MADDLDQFRELGSGLLSVDVLAGSARFDGEPIPAPHIAGELQAWFQHRLAEHQIPTDAITHAWIEADVSVRSASHGRRDSTCLTWSCRSTIQTDDGKYEGELGEEHVWVHAV